MTGKPKLGQNFLADPAASLAVVAALGDISQSIVVEIGPGKGAITRLLAARARQLIAVELDPALAAQLQIQFSGESSVRVLKQDILTVDFASFISPGADEKLVVVGNLPYYITSPILLRLFEYHGVIGRAVLMVQREVADRMAASPGSRDYGLLTATTQLYARVDNLFTLPPSAFSPPPEVYSSVLRLAFAPHFADLDVDPAEFVQFLRQSFAQKRKTLANNLRSAGFPSGLVGSSFATTDTPADIRAEALPLEAAARLFRALKRAARE